MNLTNLLLFLILVTLATYTFMPWKGIDKGGLTKILGQWFFWFFIFGLVIFIFNSVIN
jgi:hypothetical protein|tara:strand:- start:567 stop:740 length:174 start_codon:yes stop_codon:yes gene_type:complete